MRIRTVKPDFWTHKMHRSIRAESALVALALLNYADDEGRFEADMELFQSACFPLRPKLKIMDAWIELCDCGWLILYEHGQDLAGKPIRYGYIPGFERHQVINRPTPTHYPSPNDGSLITHGALTEDSSGKGRERKGKDCARVRNPCMDALAECDGFPNELTPPAWKRVAVALRDIRIADPNVTPEEIRRRHKNYGTHFDCACTSTALSSHWGKCSKAKEGSSLARPVSQQQFATFEEAAAARNKAMGYDPTTGERV